MSKKLKNQKEIIYIAEKLKRQGKKIVVFNGSFDILHFGHIESLKEAKRQGDILIILLNSDRSIENYKGPNHPVNSEKERIIMLSAVEFVDYIVLFDDLTPVDILSKIKPDIYCHGSDWGKNCIERKIIEEFRGKIHILKRKYATSLLINKILEIYAEPEIKAVFLDRDGTININYPEYCHKIEDFRFIPGVISALKKISKTDYKIIIVTNQSGIARGYYGIKDLDKLHKWMLSELKKEGIKIDKIYHCPHGPNDNCNCRKPKPGMFMKAVKDFGVNLSKSWLVGNDEKDVISGRNANIKTIKIGHKMSKDFKLEPNYYAKNLLEAVEIINKNK